MVRKLAKSRIKKRIIGFRRYLVKAFMDYPSLATTSEIVEVAKKLEKMEKKCCK
jgi:hypothetical protein